MNYQNDSCYEDWIEDDERLQARAERRARKAYERQLIRHPYPNDPDHPEPLEEEDGS